MNLSIPVLVWEEQDEQATSFRARPLFHPEPIVSSPQLERTLSKLTSTIRKGLSDLGREYRQDQLAAWTFDPVMVDKKFSFEFRFKRRTVRGNFLVVLLPDHSPRVAFCPELPGLMFEVSRGQDLRERSKEVLEQYFSRGDGASLETELTSRAWISEVEVDFAVPSTPPKPKVDPTRMSLGGRSTDDGGQELMQVGRCLDDAYPNSLHACLDRECEAQRLEKALAQKERSGQVVVGARKVGKTALIHEQVRRFREAKRHSPRRFWLLSPQRLISGMSIVGQWESRVTSILDYAADKDLVLVFDDLLGLLSAGKTRDSNLCVADVLKPYLQDRKIRVLAEASPEAWAVLRERDRGLADLLSVNPLAPTSESATLAIALEQVRAAERIHGCQFSVESLGTAIDLQRRYISDAVFPGKAAAFLSRLATRYPGQEIGKAKTLEYFHSTTGLDLRLLESEASWSRDDVQQELQELIWGQPEAVSAAVDAVMLYKAGLNDPRRPLASFLFVGPTGVGKTECAKALAQVLFTDPSRLLRFDMNEYVSPDSASRLVGTFHQPDGLLTSAVRRQPFCVLLLDEIEKAHHEVFQLLLQVLGDGRLTDARGRTVDFTHALIVMTSNLGAEEASRPIGLTGKEQQEGLTYRRAAEEFFSPEFFNRLDRVVPFGRLGREQVTELAKRLLRRFLTREGLVRRQCHLQVSQAAMEKVVDLGFHPKLGARALKRSIEAAIAGPISDRLAGLSGEVPTVITLVANPELSVQVRELQVCAPGLARPRWGAELLGRVEAVLSQRESALGSLEPLVVDGELTAQQLDYFNLKDRVRRVRGICARLASLGERRQQRQEIGHSLLLTRNWEQLLSGSPVESLRAVGQTRTNHGDERPLEGKLAELLAELSPLTLPGQEESATLEIPIERANQSWVERLLGLYREMFRSWEFTVKETLSSTSACLEITGPDAQAWAASEAGFHLLTGPSGMVLLEVLGGEHVRRVYSDRQGGLDLNTGWMSELFPTPREFEMLVLTGQPALGAVL